MKHQDLLNGKIGCLDNDEDRIHLLRRLSAAEEAYRVIEEKYRGLLENSEDIIYNHDTEGNMLYVNPAAQRLYGYTLEEFKKINLRDIVDRQYLPIAFDNIDKKIKRISKGSPQEYLTYSKDGLPVWVEVNTHPVYDGDRLITIQGIARNITERKRIEQALRDSEKRLINKINYLNALIDNMNEIFYTYDTQGKITFINNKSLDVVGYSPQETVGRELISFIPGQHREVVRKGIRDTLLRGKAGSYEVPILHKDGSLRIIKLNASPIVEAGKITGGMVLADDITERKKAIGELQLSREWFFKVFNSSPSIMVIYSLANWIIKDVNSAFINVLGYSRLEALGKTPESLYFWKDDTEQDLLRENIDENIPVRNREALFKTRSGETRVGLYSVEVLDMGGSSYILLSINDITDRKRMEKEIARLDQLNLVGEMAAGMGHEIRNPLTTVRGFLQILSVKSECAGYKDFFSIMIEELDRMNLIISEFLTLARNKIVVLRIQNLNTIVEAIAPLIRAGAALSDQTIRIELGIIPDLPLDENEIRQLILNLTRNGFEAMPAGGVLTLRTYKKDAGAVLEVHDQGPEIPEYVLDKMGTPFFTTKEKGTGLGLAVCHSIAARHNAIISMETGPGGTTFCTRFILGNSSDSR